MFLYIHISKITGTISQLLPIFGQCWSITCRRNSAFVLQVICLISFYTSCLFVLISVISIVFHSYLPDEACNVLLSDCSSDSFVLKDGIFGTIFVYHFKLVSIQCAICVCLIVNLQCISAVKFTLKVE
jgi:hypothetical protein